MQVEVFHGTMRNFKDFRITNRRVSTRGYCGAAYYFTDSREDAVKNYAHPNSPDTKATVEFLLEQNKGSKNQLNKRFYQVSRLYRVSATLDNPFTINNDEYVGGTDRVSYKRVHNYVMKVLQGESNQTINNTWGDIYEKLIDGCKMKSFWESINTLFVDIYDEEINQCSEIARNIVRLLGYDSIIMPNVYNFFPGLMRRLNNPHGINHYILFNRKQFVVNSDAILL